MKENKILNIIGVILVFFIITGLGIIVYNISNPPEKQIPEIDWEFERINSSHVQIKHNGGYTVSSSNIAITVDRYRRGVSWSGKVKEGDTTIILAKEDRVISIYWLTERKRELIGKWQG